MAKLGFYFTDASFDYKTKSASIGIYDIHNDKKHSLICKAGNPTDAETQGIEETLKIAYKEQLSNVIIVCDNKVSIKNIKGRIKDMGYQFGYLQFLWLPREYTNISDFLSKNLEEKDVEKYIQIKEEQVRAGKQKIDNKMSKRYVKDIEYEKNFEDDALQKRLREFIALSFSNDLTKDNFSSNLVKGIFENKSVLELENIFLEEGEINLLENDIKNMKNILLRINLELIKDLLIFN